MKNKNNLNLNAKHPKRSVLEEIGNSITHGTGSIFAIVLFILMLSKSSSPIQSLSASIYFAGLLITFTISCLYHALPYGSKAKRLFRRFDYCSIYLLIGATFAPLLLNFVSGNFGKIFFILQWFIIITGITFVGVFGPTRLRALHITLYVVLGWSGLIFLPQMFSRCLPLLFYILGGGIIYSLGIIPFALKKKCSHFIWHFFVMLGAVIHGLGIYFYVF